MEVSSNHIIESHVFEVELKDKERTNEFFDRIKSISYDELLEIIDDVLTGISIDGYTFQIDRVELEIGSINPDNFEYELRLRIEEALINYFKGAFAPNGRLTTGKTVTQELRLLDQFETYLKWGHYNWNTNKTTNPVELATTLLNTNPEGVSRVLEEYLSQDEARKRFIYQFDDKLISRFVASSKRSFGERLLGYRNEIKKDQMKHKRVDVSENKFRVVLWDITLAYLYLKTHSFHGRKQFLSYYFQKVSQQYRIDYKSLLQTVSIGIKKFSEKMSVDSDFAEIVRELLTEVDQNQFSVGNDNTQNFDQIKLAFDYIFSNGTFLEKSELNSFQSLNERVYKEFRFHPAETKEFFKKIVADKSKRGNLELLLNAENLNLIISNVNDFEIENRRDMYDRILTASNKDEVLRRKVVPILQSIKGRIILKALTEHPGDGLKLLDLALGFVFNHNGLSGDVKRHFKTVLIQLLDEGQQKKVSTFPYFKRTDFNDPKKSTSIFLNAINPESTDEEVLKHIAKSTGSAKTDYAKLKRELLAIGFKENRAKKMADALKVLESAEARKAVVTAQYMPNDSLELRAFKLFEKLIQTPGSNTLVLADSGFLKQLEDTLENLLRKMEEDDRSSEQKVEKELKIFTAKFNWLDTALIQRIKSELLNSLETPLKIDSGRNTFVFTEEQKTKYKKQLFQQVNSNELTEIKPLLEFILQLSNELNIDEKEIVSALLKDLLDDSAFKRLSTKFDPGVIKGILPKLRELKATYSNNAEGLYRAIKENFRHLSNAEADELKETLFENDSATKLMPLVKKVYESYQTTEDIEETPPPQVDFKVLQHWLIKTEKLYETWKLSAQINHELRQAIKKLASSQKTTFKTVAAQLLGQLKSRHGLTPFESELINIIVAESDDQMLKKDIQREKNELDHKLISNFLKYNQIPDWYDHKDFKQIVDLIKKSLKENPVKFVQELQAVNHHPGLFSKENFLDLIRHLNDHPINRFYQNIVIAEKLFEYDLKGLFGVKEGDIQTLRKRLFIFGIKTNFQGDSQQFFNRLRFMSQRLINIPEEKMEKLIYYSENDLDNRSVHLLFWKSNFRSRKELLDEIETTNVYSDYAKSWFNLLVDKQPITQQQLKLFKDLIPKIKSEKLLDSETFIASLNDRGVRSKMIETVGDDFLLEIVQSDLNANSSASVAYASTLLEKFKLHLSTKHFNQLRSLWFDQLLKLYAVGGLRKLNAENWKALFYRTVEKAVGMNEIQRLLDKDEEIKEEAKTFLVQVQDELIQHAEASEVLIEEEELPEAEKVFVENAGLVIIAPYFSRLFSRLEMTQNGKFKDEESKFKAVCYTQYLATGKLPKHENELVLNKVLCGMSIADPVELIDEIPQEDMDLMEGLLKSITQQWTPLQSTSVEGLRESFLIRDGRLRQDDEYYYLNVETKTFDMLIDRLPWSINLIKIGWMKKPLNVEWR